MSTHADRTVRLTQPPILSPIEYDIVLAFTQGLSVAAIAWEPEGNFYSEETIYKFVASIKQKLGVNSTSDLRALLYGISETKLKDLLISRVHEFCRDESIPALRTRFLAGLTNEEIHLLDQMCDQEFAAMSVEQRARSLSLHRSTLNEKLTKLYEKLQVRSYAEATLVAARLEGEIQAEKRFRETWGKQRRNYEY